MRLNFSKVHSIQPNLIDATLIDIEVDISNGLHSFAIVGLGDKSIGEAKDRISSAIKNSGFISPKQKNQKIVISLAPADIQKSGTNFDLAMAIAYLKSANEIQIDTSNKIFIGELSLDGRIRPVKGILQSVIHAEKHGFTEIYIPKENVPEAILFSKIKIFGVNSFSEIIQHLTNNSFKLKSEDSNSSTDSHNDINNFLNDPGIDNLIGNEFAKRAVTIAMAGGHNIAIHGPPGTGKTLLSKSIAKILPPLSKSESIETSSIYSSIQILKEPIIFPPIRSPHHTSSYSAMVGGGHKNILGEITLAHNGVLIMDEFPEFDKRTINALRQPLEEQCIFIARANDRTKLPANFILVATMNPCPCGYYKTGIQNCLCTENMIRNYRKKISGPISDRIDIWIKVNKINYDELKIKNIEKDKIQNLSLLKMQKIINETRNIQNSRSCRFNSRLTNQEILKYCHLNTETEKLLIDATKKLKLSIRSYYKTIKIARTIADIENSREIKTPHLLEALQYRINYIS